MTPPAEGPAVFTIGHSTGLLEPLVLLLERHGITMLVDVRSRPNNSFVPQFNRDRIKMTLIDRGIVYAYLGERLGRVPEGPTFAQRSQVDLVGVERSQVFQEGIEWVAEEAKRGRLCLFCGEADPSLCHRDYLIAQNLLRRGVRVLHILPDGELRPAVPDLFHLPGGAHGLDSAD